MSTDPTRKMGQDFRAEVSEIPSTLNLYHQLIESYAPAYCEELERVLLN